MNTKQTIILLTIIGGTIGSFIPLLWGDNLLSFSSVIFTAIGGFLGIYIGYKLRI
ncbi:MAG TPA: hypothetical protein VL576_00240 [Candidatus Paceibacterota bacterium]|nr:hypothetical protein [Candidatus Paceibacterota bacterium]